jgi:hypothetical protein
MWTNIFLTRVETSTPETFATPFGFKFRKAFKPVLRPILRLASGRRIHVESYPKLEKDQAYIFVSTHSFVDDIITNYAIVDRSAYTLIGTPDQVEHNPLLYAAWLCGMVFVNKVDPQNRKDAVEKMVRVLENNTSVIVYAEGAWNNTENLLVQPLFASPWILAQRTGCKVVPVAMHQEYKKKDIWYRAGDPIDLAGMEKKEGLDKLRDAMATLTWELMEDHAAVVKRGELGPDPRLDYIDERMREYLCTKWTRDDWALEVTIYRDKELPPTPEAVRASLDDVTITPNNAAILAPVLARREEDKRYDLVSYMQKNWRNS